MKRRSILIYNLCPRVVRIHFQTNPWNKVFEKINRLHFVGPLKTFCTPQNPYFALKPQHPNFGESYFQNFLFWAVVLEISRADFTKRWVFQTWSFSANLRVLGSKNVLFCSKKSIWNIYLYLIIIKIHYPTLYPAIPDQYIFQCIKWTQIPLLFCNYHCQNVHQFICFQPWQVNLKSK